MKLTDLKKYFWDCGIKELTIEKYPGYITERILTYGTESECHWIREQVGENLFKEIATTGRRLDKKTKNYWQKYYKFRYNAL